MNVALLDFDITSTAVYSKCSSHYRYYTNFYFLAGTDERGKPTENNVVTIVIGSALFLVVISLVFGIVLASTIAFIKVQKNKRAKQDNFVRVKQINNSTNRHNNFDSVQVHIESHSESAIDTLDENVSSLPTANTQKVYPCSFVSEPSETYKSIVLEIQKGSVG